MVIGGHQGEQEEGGHWREFTGGSRGRWFLGPLHHKSSDESPGGCVDIPLISYESWL